MGMTRREWDKLMVRLFSDELSWKDIGRWFHLSYTGDSDLDDLGPHDPNNDFDYPDEQDKDF
jgi:hypothetical protein